MEEIIYIDFLSSNDVKFDELLEIIFKFSELKNDSLSNKK